MGPATEYSRADPRAKPRYNGGKIELGKYSMLSDGFFCCQNNFFFRSGLITYRFDRQFH